eukprot:jgi/Tetstr1/420819/TSEL_011895.t1
MRAARALCAALLLAIPPPPPPPPQLAPPDQLIEGDGTLSYSAPAYVYPVDWEAVPSTLDEGTPQAAELITSVGTCACDMTLAGCDANCCCDADCTEDVVDTMFSYCLPEGPQPPSLEYCIRNASVALVNLPSSSSLVAVTKEAADPESFMEQLLCIADDNNPTLGVYFMDPPPGTDADLENPPPSWPVEYEPADTSTSTRTADTSTSRLSLDDEGFKVGDSIPAFYVNGTAVVPVPGQVFALPSAQYSRVCDSARPVQFGYGLPFSPTRGGNTCQQLLPSLADACVDGSPALSGALLVNTLQLAVRQTGTQRRPVVLADLQYRNIDGTVTRLATAGGLPSLSLRNNICNNTLVAVRYTVIYEAPGDISQVEAAVTVAAVEGNPDGSAQVLQEFSVEFTDSADAITRRPASGSPGYRPGHLLLAGILAEESNPSNEDGRTAVRRLVDGLPLSVGSPQDGTCGVEHYQPITFGANRVSSCAVPLTSAQLESFCRGQRTAGVPDTNPGIPLQLMGGLLDPDQPTMVGRWGNSDANNVNEWIEVVQDANATAMRWNDATKTCTNVLSGLQFEFLTNFVGASYNPQSQVAFARVQFLRSDWTFRNQLEPEAPQDFFVTSRVQFVAQEQPAAEAVRGNNPFILPRFPADVFYPFTNSAPRAPVPLAALLLLLPLAAAVLL